MLLFILNELRFDFQEGNHWIWETNSINDIQLPPVLLGLNSVFDGRFFNKRNKDSIGNNIQEESQNNNYVKHS